jgi:hypothetical protein
MFLSRAEWIDCGCVDSTQKITRRAWFYSYISRAYLIWQRLTKIGSHVNDFYSAGEFFVSLQATPIGDIFSRALVSRYFGVEC